VIGLHLSKELLDHSNKFVYKEVKMPSGENTLFPTFMIVPLPTDACVIIGGIFLLVFSRPGGIYFYSKVFESLYSHRLITRSFSQNQGNSRLMATNRRAGGPAIRLGSANQKPCSMHHFSSIQLI
jgi:hypothetical protein